MRSKIAAPSSLLANPMPDPNLRGDLLLVRATPTVVDCGLYQDAAPARVFLPDVLALHVLFPQKLALGINQLLAARIE